MTVEGVKKFFTHPVTLIVLALVIVAGAFWLGTIKSREWADSEYLQERDERAKKIAVLEADAARHEKNETQLAAENALLRKQNEATAEILKKSDAKLAGDAANLTKLLDERNKRYEEIDADSDYGAQLCGMCRDFARSGFALSDATCGRCKAAP